jgi:flagellar motor switch protein FliM
MSQRGTFTFSRKIKLAPAVGDWTSIQYQDSDLDEITVSSVRNTNFDSLPKDHLKYVHYIHYRLAERMTKKLSQDLDIKVELHSIVASQMAYDDFLTAQQSQIVQTDFVLGENGRVNILFEWALADMIVNRLVGGKGEESSTESFSDLEGEILKAQMHELMPLFVDAWKSIFTQDQLKLDFYCGKFTQDKKLSLREAYITFTFYFYFGSGDLRKVTWAYPNHILRKLLTIRQSFTDPIKKRVSVYPTTMEKTKVPVKVTLGQATLRMEDLNHLQVGDVVTLDTRLDAPLSVQVGDSTTVLSGQPGVTNNRLSVQLLMMDDTQAKPMRSVMPLAAAFSAPVANSVIESVSPIVAQAPAAPWPHEETTPEESDAPDFFEGSPLSSMQPAPAPLVSEPAEALSGDPDPFEETLDETEEYDDVDNWIDEEEEQEEDTLDGEGDIPGLNEPPPPKNANENDWDDDFSWDDLDTE